MRFGIGLLILDGLIVRRVGVAGRFGAELLGDGDLMDPFHAHDMGTSLPRTGKWRVLRDSHLPVLLLVLYGAISWSLSPSPELSRAEWLRLACSAALYFVVASTLHRREQVRQRFRLLITRHLDAAAPQPRLHFLRRMLPRLELFVSVHFQYSA